MEQVDISREIVETMGDGIIAIDADGAIVYVSGPAAALAGYSAGELLGTSIELLVPAALRAAHEAHRERYVETPTPRAMGTQLDTRLRHRDGREIAVDIGLSALDGPDGRRVVAVVRDATAAREAQRLTAERAHLLELAHDGILIRRAAGSVITYWSQGAVELYGFTRRQAIGRSSHELLQTAFPVSLEEIASALEERGRWQGELIHTRRDGSKVVVSSRQVLVGGEGHASIFEINRDISEERRGRDRLEAVRGVLEAILAGRSQDDALGLVARHAREFAGAALASVALLEPDGEEVTIRAADGARAERLAGLRRPAGSTLSGQAIAARRTVQVADLTALPDVFAAVAGIGGIGPVLVVPLLGQAGALGTLVAGRPRGAEPFGDAQRMLLEQFAATATVVVEYGLAREGMDRVRLLEDRERIGRELHDGTIQTLFALSMQMQHSSLRTRDRELAGRLEDTVKTIDGVIRDLRGYIFGLRPALLAERTLEQALRELVREFDRDSGVSTALEVVGEAVPAVAGMSADIVQVVAEALSNIRKHAEAQTCRVELLCGEASVVLRIEDDGRGFDPATVSGSGNGLRNFRKRAERMGGALMIEAPDDGGAAIVITIPT